MLRQWTWQHGDKFALLIECGVPVALALSTQRSELWLVVIVSPFETPEEAEADRRPGGAYFCLAEAWRALEVEIPGISIPPELGVDFLRSVQEEDSLQN